MDALDRAKRKVQQQHKPSRNGTARPVSPEPPPTVETFTAPELLAMELPAPKWAVEDVIPEGLSVLAGAPKLGKSWLALGTALAVAYGGLALGTVQVAPGDVLYLGLEDTKRRFQSRIRKMIGVTNDAAPERLTGATSWPRADQGGVYAILEWLHEHPEARLVVIDTLQKFRSAKKYGHDAYEQDYEHLAQIKAMADQRGVAVMVLHHTRKMIAADPLESVSGTMGLTGAVDAVLVLKRERGQHDATLFVTGRDIEEAEYALSFDRVTGLWQAMGTAADFRMTKERTEVINLLKKAGGPMTPKAINDALGKKIGATKMLLGRMADDGLLKNLGGIYGLPICN